MTRHLILDIETNSTDPNKADIKVFGALDVETDKYYIWKWEKDTYKKVIELIKQFDWVITFNGILYDIPILERHKVSYPYWKNIDMYNTIKKRPLLFNKDGFDSFKLKNIIAELKLDIDGKGDIDYNIFIRDSSTWTKDEIQDIIKYLKQDLLITKKLWDFAVKKFEPFKDFISEKDIRRYKHITSAAGGYAYKVICNRLGIEELYDENIIDGEKYKGAFVSAPSQESAIGLIVDDDFASLYPMINIMANLYSHSCTCCTHNEKWHGNNNLIISGYYCSKIQGQIELCIKDLFLERKKLKQSGDVRENAIKLTINSMYGISGNPRFIQLFNINTASDCTSIGQQCIKYARKRLSEEGYIVLYSDTDSAYIKIPDGKTLEDHNILTKKISQEIISWFPFPWQEFNFKVDEIIKYIHFFPDEDGNFKKKNYIFINDRDELIIKGLQIIKLNCSKLSKKIFDEDLKPQIIKNLNCKFEYSYIIKLIENYLKNDLSLGVKRFNAKSEYSDDTSIWAQILAKYGDGEHELIKNYKIGAGKKAKYCTLNEAKNLSFSDLDLEVYIKELSPFIINNSKNNTKYMGLNDYL